MGERAGRIAGVGAITWGTALYGGKR